jgi:2'-5' RNA ligase
MESLEDCCSSNGFHRINQFALVSYIPDPLGHFLDDLRLRLVPDCKPHAHVTILPPRPLCGEAEQAASEIRRLADDFSPFTVKLGNIAKFPISDVIYIEVATGREELQKMYKAMNCGTSSFSEAFKYHPHITLAQKIPPEKVQELFETARNEWANYRHERSFRVETLSFVQNTSICHWIDLAEIPLPIHAGR